MLETIVLSVLAVSLMAMVNHHLSIYLSIRAAILTQLILSDASTDDLPQHKAKDLKPDALAQLALIQSRTTSTKEQ